MLIETYLPNVSDRTLGEFSRFVETLVMPQASVFGVWLLETIVCEEDRRASLHSDVPIDVTPIDCPCDQWSNTDFARAMQVLDLVARGGLGAELDRLFLRLLAAMFRDAHRRWPEQFPVE